MQAVLLGILHGVCGVAPLALQRRLCASQRLRSLFACEGDDDVDRDEGASRRPCCEMAMVLGPLSVDFEAASLRRMPDDCCPAGVWWSAWKNLGARSRSPTTRRTGRRGPSGFRWMPDDSGSSALGVGGHPRTRSARARGGGRLQAADLPKRASPCCHRAQR